MKRPKTIDISQKLDAEDLHDLTDPEVRADVEASRAEHRAGKSYPAEELQEEFDCRLRDESAYR